MKSLFNTHSIIIIIGLLMLFFVFFAPNNAFMAEISQAPNSSSESQKNTTKDVINQTQGVLKQAEALTEQGKDLSDKIPTDLAGMDQSGILSRVWQGIKGFFADGEWKTITIDIGKTVLKIIANIFIIIANVINKILSWM